MLFSSLEFLYLFLPLTLVAYFICPNGGKNHVLLVASLVFYGIADPKYIPLMLAVSLGDYALGLLIAAKLKGGKEKSARLLVGVTAALNVLVLFLFKYLDPLLSFFKISPLGLTLPPGISFYTFQAMSYVFDVYRRETEAQRDPLTFATYVSLFPQLVAGPIVRYSEVAHSLKKRAHSLSLCADGIRLFAVGLAKKILLANGAGEVWQTLATGSRVDGTVIGAWLGIIFFAFQIYYDFSGYSDMAKGLGRIFGFEFPDNFRYPYISKSITEFWRRWHITLSMWFREYVYIPLGGNRRGKGRMYVNLLITWLLTGAWHGAGLNFILWGLYFFSLLALEKAFLLKALSRLPKAVCRLYALFFILLGWLIFACDGEALEIADGVRYMGQMLGIGCPLANNDSLFELWRNLPYLFIMAIGATPLPSRFMRRLQSERPVGARIAACTLGVFSLVICTCYLADSGYNPFLYFRF